MAFLYLGRNYGICQKVWQRILVKMFSIGIALLKYLENVQINKNRDMPWKYQ